MATIKKLTINAVEPLSPRAMCAPSPTLSPNCYIYDEPTEDGETTKDVPDISATLERVTFPFGVNANTHFNDDTVFEASTKPGPYVALNSASKTLKTKEYSSGDGKDQGQNCCVQKIKHNNKHTKVEEKNFNFHAIAKHRMDPFEEGIPVGQLVQKDSKRAASPGFKHLDFPMAKRVFKAFSQYYTDTNKSATSSDKREEEINGEQTGERQGGINGERNGERYGEKHGERNGERNRERNGERHGEGNGDRTSRDKCTKLFDTAGINTTDRKLAIITKDQIVVTPKLAAEWNKKRSKQTIQNRSSSENRSSVTKSKDLKDTFGYKSPVPKTFRLNGANNSPHQPKKISDKKQHKKQHEHTKQATSPRRHNCLSLVPATSLDKFNDDIAFGPFYFVQQRKHSSAEKSETDPSRSNGTEDGTYHNLSSSAGGDRHIEGPKKHREDIFFTPSENTETSLSKHQNEKRKRLIPSPKTEYLKKCVRAAVQQAKAKDAGEKVTHGIQHLAHGTVDSHTLKTKAFRLNTSPVARQPDDILKDFKSGERQEKMAHQTAVVKRKTNKEVKAKVVGPGGDLCCKYERDEKSPSPNRERKQNQKQRRSSAKNVQFFKANMDLLIGVNVNDAHVVGGK